MSTDKISALPVKVIVLEALPLILTGFNQKLADFAKEKMIERGIDIRLKTAVTSFDGNEVTIKSLDETPNNASDDSKIDVKIIDDGISKTQLGVIPEFFPINEWAHITGVRDRNTDSSIL